MYIKISMTFLCLAFVMLAFSSCFKESKEIAEPMPMPTTAHTALQSYLNNEDDAFKWELKEKYQMEDVIAQDILLTSQKWREHVWTHQLTIFIPEHVAHDGSLLFITGGSVKEGLPNWKAKDNDEAMAFGKIAHQNNAITAILRQTPNQPLYNDLVEDQLISFTLHNFKNDNDFTWPLLFPMVKSATRAMDAITDYSMSELNKKISRFTVSGASKRGWTTWLTGASDSRVEAIGPMVIDVLNMPVSLDYQVEAWKEYSIQIEDYTKLEIPQTVNTPTGDAITQMIDPYSYRKTLTMPKIIFIGTNDEYWPVDAIKNYIYEIPGENYIHYVPNAGHNLNGGEQALRALGGFWGRTLKRTPYHKLKYFISSDETSATISVHSTSDEILNAYLWSADSDDRDFRDEEFVSENISSTHMSDTNYKVSFPKRGFKAFYIDLEFSDQHGGTYTKSSRMYLVDDDEVL